MKFQRLISILENDTPLLKVCDPYIAQIVTEKFSPFFLSFLFFILFL